MNQPRPILKALTPALLSQLVVAVIAVLTAFEVVTLNDTQMGAILGLLSVVGIILTTLGILSGENQSTPIESPRLAQGTEVTVVTPKGQPDTKATV